MTTESSEQAESRHHTTGTFTTAPEIDLFEESWETEGKADGALVIVHGFAEHCTRYGHVAEKLNQNAFSVYAYDQRGHGNSPGKRAYIERLEYLTNDLSVFVDRVRGRIGDTPLFLMGHSMGGLVLASYVLRHDPQVRGVVFSSSALKIAADTKPILQKVSGFLSAVAPTLPVMQLDAKAISRIPEEVGKYVNDPKVYHGKMLARTAYEMMSGMKDVQQRFPEFRLPVLFLHGTADTLVDVEASKAAFERAGAEDKTLTLYEGAFHEVFNDNDRERFLSDLIAWLKHRC